MYKRIDSEVSQQEMMRLREEGLTNKQIADRLDLCTRTVVRYIGTQPKGLRAPNGSASAKANDVEKPKVIAPKCTLKIDLQVTNYAEEIANYKVTSLGTVEITGAPERLGAEELQKYILELMEIYSTMEG